MSRLARAFKRSAVRAVLAAALMAAAPAATPAQTPNSWSPGDVPRFLLVPADSTQPPAVVDPADVPILRRRIAVHVSGSTRREALRQIGRASGLEFVYANDLVPPGDSVRLQADDITVAAALTEVLLGAGVDVAIGANGNAILVKRTVVLAQAPRKDVVRGRVTTDSGIGDRRRGRHRHDGSDGRDVPDAHRFVGELLHHHHRRQRGVSAVRRCARPEIVPATAHTHGRRHDVRRERQARVERHDDDGDRSRPGPAPAADSLARGGRTKRHRRNGQDRGRHVRRAAPRPAGEPRRHGAARARADGWFRRRDRVRARRGRQQDHAERTLVRRRRSSA